MTFRITGLVAVLAAAALLVPSAAVSRGSHAVASQVPQQNELVGTVGPGFVITLTRDGQAVSHLEPGSYTITVNDRSSEHNFHLSGPGGVDVATDVPETGTRVFNVTLTDGTYRFQCDPHAASMRGNFTVGSVQSPPPPPPPAAATKRLVGSVGPGFTISLRTTGGKKVTRTKAGRYRITVRDRSRNHNFHLKGAGANKATTVPFRGTVTWTVRLRKGKTYRFQCDPHASNMRGSLRAT